MCSMLIVGLTGGIACGKSTVSKGLTERGIPIIDCDLITFDAARKVRGPVKCAMDLCSAAETAVLSP